MPATSSSDHTGFAGFSALVMVPRCPRNPPANVLTTRWHGRSALRRGRAAAKLWLLPRRPPRSR